MVNLCETLCPEASPASTVKGNGPLWLVIPLMVPSVASKAKPEGREPEAIFQRYGAVPPVTWKTAEYGVPSVASGRLAAAIVRFAGVVGALTLTEAMARLPGSALLVAISCTVVGALTFGAVKSP